MPREPAWAFSVALTVLRAVRLRPGGPSGALGRALRPDLRLGERWPLHLHLCAGAECLLS